MKHVILFRHGIAEPHGEKPDAERELTDEGRKRVRLVGRALPKLFDAEAILSSPLTRCVQTARIISKAYSLEASETKALEPATTAEAVVEFILQRPEERLLLVGHEPSLSETMLRMAGMSDGPRQELKRAGFYLIALDEQGAGKLEWLIAPRVLRRLR